MAAAGADGTAFRVSIGVDVTVLCVFAAAISVANIQTCWPYVRESECDDKDKCCARQDGMDRGWIEKPLTGQGFYQISICKRQNSKKKYLQL